MEIPSVSRGGSQRLEFWCTKEFWNIAAYTEEWQKPSLVVNGWERQLVINCSLIHYNQEKLHSVSKIKMIWEADFSQSLLTTVSLGELFIKCSIHLIQLELLVYNEQITSRHCRLAEINSGYSTYFALGVLAFGLQKPNGSLI